MTYKKRQPKTLYRLEHPRSGEPNYYAVLTEDEKISLWSLGYQPLGKVSKTNAGCIHTYSDLKLLR